MSKNDSWAAMKKKTEDYLKAGVRAVWVADPKARTVTVFRKGQETTLSQSDVLTAEDIIPGFEVSVGALFQE